MAKKIIITESQLKKLLSEQEINQNDNTNLYNGEDFTGELVIRDGAGIIGFYRISVGLKDNYNLDSMEFDVSRNGNISVFQDMGFPPEKIQQGKELVKQYMEKMDDRLPSGFSWFNLNDPCSDAELWECS